MPDQVVHTSLKMRLTRFRHALGFTGLREIVVLSRTLLHMGCRSVDKELPLTMRSRRAWSSLISKSFWRETRRLLSISLVSCARTSCLQTSTKSESAAHEKLKCDKYAQLIFQVLDMVLHASLVCFTRPFKLRLDGLEVTHKVFETGFLSQQTLVLFMDALIEALNQRSTWFKNRKEELGKPSTEYSQLEGWQFRYEVVQQVSEPRATAR